MGFGARGDIIGRVIGMMVFLLGIFLLVVVFMYAFRLFGLSPADALGLRFTGDPKKDPLLSQIGSNFLWIVLRVAFLFVMALAASLISQRGINLYFSAAQGSPLVPRSVVIQSSEPDPRGEAL